MIISWNYHLWLNASADSSTTFSIANALTAQRELRHFFPKIVDKVIRTSNSDIIIYDHRVSPGPSPMLWVDLRNNNGKRLLQKVV